MTSRPAIRVSPTQRLALTNSLTHALRVLHMDAEGLSRYLEEQASENPALVVRPALPAEGEWLPRWSGVISGGSMTKVDDAPDQGPGLMAHVVAQLPSLVPVASDRRIALAVVEALEPTGWLSATSDQIALEAGVPVDDVDRIIAQLQRIEPAGLFARNLSDCLRLQAIEAGVFDAEMAALIADLPRVAGGDWAGLARATRLDEAKLRAAFARLRGFNPKPGTAFSAIHSPIREPDILVSRAEDGWSVRLNRSSLPDLAIDAKAKGAGKARAVQRLVETRNATLLAVARCILDHQRDALEQGTMRLRPLKMQDVADHLAIHKSTVSRVVSGTAVDTPQGTWWLRSLFSSDLGADTGAAAIRARLARLVATEDKRKPLSDEALANTLSEGGAVIARRTIAKYRASLGIGPAHSRKTAWRS